MKSLEKKIRKKWRTPEQESLHQKLQEQRWEEHEFTPKQAVKWMKAEFKVSDAEFCRESGITFRGAKAWKEKGLSIQAMREWQEYGLTPEEAMEWDISPSVLSESSLGWIKAGFKSKETVQIMNATYYMPEDVQTLFTAECKEIQVLGFMACQNCKNARKVACSGQSIIRTGTNLFGQDVPVSLRMEEIG